MRTLSLSLIAAVSFFALPALAAESDAADDAAKAAAATLKEASEGVAVPYTIEYRKSEFVPFELEVVANKKLAITVKNTGQQPIEFESKQLNREKIVQPNTEAVLYVPPLKPGTYKFFNDFNPAQKGFITAK